MGEGFIVRRGGGGQQTVKPIYNSLTEVGFTSLTLNVTNDSNSIATLYYSVVNNEPAPDQANTFETEFAGKETKDITITGLTNGTTYTVYLKAIAIGEFPSETIIVTELTTGVAITATGGTTQEYNLDGKRYKSHTFTSVGTSTFQVTQLSNLGGTFNQVDYLIVAGGAAGINGYGGGGGAGGVIPGQTSIQAQSYPIVVGAGGQGRIVSSGATGFNGQNSSVFGLTALGGGGGASYSSATPANGGSGGGSAFGHSGNAGTAPTNGGSGLQPTSASGGLGNHGGAGSATSGNRAYWGGGGGGATSIGQNGINGGIGGSGFTSSIRNGTNAIYATGGGGGQYNTSTKLFNTGGSSNVHNNRGGHGSEAGGNATANTGSGGGGVGGVGQGFSGTGTPGSGASGIVIIRYEIAPTN